MAYVSLYRKYRSQSFGDLIGQNHVVRTLQNGIESGRISHSYLFTGPRGTGKTSSARLLAKALCCEQGPIPEPCNECDICLSITEGSCIDVHEFDAASESGVDEIRETIVSVVDYKPAICRYKVFIIDEVHDLSGKAFDALLKTVEEPPDHVIFILATTEFNKVPPTIRSRCQKFEFHRATMQDLISRLKYVADAEGVTVEPAALGAIAQMADGGYRDALTLLEQAILTSEGTITLQHVYDQLGLVSETAVDELLLGMKAGDVPKVVELLSELYRLGRDPRSILESMLHRLSDLTRAGYGLDLGLSIDPTRDAVAHETAARLGREGLLEIRSALAEAHKVIRDISLPRLWLEAELIRVGQVVNRPAVVPTVAAIPTQTPTPAPKPEPKAAVQATPKPEVAKPEPVVAPKSEATGDPELDKALRAWLNTVTELSTVSKLMAMKLGHAKVVSAKPGQAVVEFERTHELDWVNESPKRLGALQEAMAKHYGGGIKLDLVAAKKESNGAVSATVELPAEGAKLRDLAQQVFESGSGD
ncbi:MAG: DNA polymerase III subunit gamma/tau [Fimbriimonadales bacterium]